MLKNILWLDDQFTKLHEHFLQDYINAFENRATLHKCNRLSLFADILESQTFHGIILDVMLRREENVINYDALGQPKVPYRAEQAGIDIAKIIRGIGNISNEGCYQQAQLLPILLLTGESDDPEKRYRKEHPDLFEHINNDDSPPIRIHSKGESAIYERLQDWLKT